MCPQSGIAHRGLMNQRNQNENFSKRECRKAFNLDSSFLGGWPNMGFRGGWSGGHLPCFGAYIFIGALVHRLAYLIVDQKRRVRLPHVPPTEGKWTGIL